LVFRFSFIIKIHFFEHMKKGFTMIELFVVMTIMGILSSVTFLNWRHGEQLFALQSSAYQLSQDIKEAREMTMSAKVCTMCGDIVPLRYGIYLHGEGSNFYQLFAEINNDDGLFLYPHPGSDGIAIKTTEFEDGIYLDTVEHSIDCSPKASSRVHLTFAPPDPKTVIWIGRPTHPVFPPVQCSKVILNLRIGASGETKSVIINQAGLIYVE